MGKIRNPVLDFILYLVTAYIIWECTLYVWHEHRLKHQIHDASLEDVSKNKYDKQFTTVTTYKILQTIYHSNYTQKCSKIVQWKRYI